MLKLIDCKVSHIETAITAGRPAPAIVPMASLLNGPQSDARGMNQRAVDVLFGSLS